MNFHPVRADGRSAGQVMFDLVRGAAPDTLFSYDELTEALSKGLAEPVAREAIYRAAADASAMLLREEMRALVVVPTVGYRIARAEEHLPLAKRRRRFAERHMRRGQMTLERTRLDELSDQMRQDTIGAGIIFAMQMAILSAHEKRLNRNDVLIQSLFERVEALEKR
jgi:hypothetical protein